MGYKLKIGDRVLVTKSTESEFFSTGDHAVLVEPSNSGSWWADFNNQDNESVVGDGIWSLQCAEFVLD